MLQDGFLNSHDVVLDTVDRLIRVTIIIIPFLLSNVQCLHYSSIRSLFINIFTSDVLVAQVFNVIIHVCIMM